MLTPAAFSRAIRSRFRGSSANARTDAATTGPMSGADCSASIGASRTRSIVRKWRASVAAAFSPTCRMPERVDQPRQVVGPAPLDLLDDVAPDLAELPRPRAIRPRLPRRDDELLELVGVEAIEVREVVDEPERDQLIDERLAQPFDVHGGARREVLEAPAQPRRARRVLAAPDHFLGVAAQLAAAHRARRRA